MTHFLSYRPAADDLYFYPKDGSARVHFAATIEGRRNDAEIIQRLMQDPNAVLSLSPDADGMYRQHFLELGVRLADRIE